MVKSLVASALPSGNAPFLPENCYNYKFFGIHIFLYVVCIGPTQKNWRKPPKSDIFPHPNSTPPKMGWTKVLSPHSLPCENNCEKNAWRTPPSPKPPLQSSPTTAGWSLNCWEEKTGTDRRTKSFVGPPPGSGKNAWRTVEAPHFDGPWNCFVSQTRHQTSVSAKSVHCIPFWWLLCKSVQNWVQNWLSYTLECAAL